MLVHCGISAKFAYKKLLYVNDIADICILNLKGSLQQVIQKPIFLSTLRFLVLKVLTGLIVITSQGKTTRGIMRATLFSPP